MSGEVAAGQVRERGDVWEADGAGRGGLQLIYRLVLLLSLLLVFSLTVTRAAHGGVPTTTDFADCNAEAPRVVKGRSRLTDHGRPRSSRWCAWRHDELHRLNGSRRPLP
jgi:hypothetical protein